MKNLAEFSCFFTQNLCGTSENQADFDPGPGVQLADSGYLYILKLDAAGDFVWVRKMGTLPGSMVGGLFPSRISVDPQGNVYTIGSHWGLIDFDPGPGMFSVFGDGMYIHKLDSAGNFAWVRTIGNANVTLTPKAIAASQHNQIGIAGEFDLQETVLDFDPGPDSFLLSYSIPYNYTQNVFVLSLDEAGNFIWVKPLFPGYQYYNYVGQMTVNDLEVDDCGNFYATGRSVRGIEEGLLHSDPEDHDVEARMYVLKLDPASNLIWESFAGGEDADAEGVDVDVDKEGNVYATGFLDEWFYSYSLFEAIVRKINQPDTTETDTLVVTSCLSYTSPSGEHIWTSSGIYQDTLGDGGYCTQILVIDLTILQGDGAPTIVNVDTTICAGNPYVSPSSTYQWMTSGTYADTIATACDTILYDIHLQVEMPTDTTIFASSCNSQYLLNGYGYSQTGTYTQTLVNQVGCDSTITLHYTKLESTDSIVTVTGCGSVTYNNVSYFVSGTYVQQLTNADGCDSTLILYVFLGQSGIPTILTETACSSFTLNGSVYTNSGTYSQVLTDQFGCDSLVQLNLTIGSQPISVVQNGLILTASTPDSASYQWVDCSNGYAPIPGESNPDFLVTANGNYAVIVDSGTCTDTSECFLISSVGLEGEFRSQLSYYPNPSTGQVTIEFGTMYEEIAVTVWNMLGQQESTFRTKHTESFPIHLPEERGFYLLQVQADDQTAWLKVLRE